MYSQHDTVVIFMSFKMHGMSESFYVSFTKVFYLAVCSIFSKKKIIFVY